VIGAKSLMRLEAAADMIRYYETVGRALTPQNIRWEPTIKTFAEHWKALQDRKEGETLEVPRVTRQLPVIQWTEVFADYCNRKIGARTIPLAYVIRTDVDVPAAAPPLAPATGHGNQVMPYSVEHESVEKELVARASHQHTTYATDNADVYAKSQAKLIVAAVRQYHEEEAKTKQKENEHDDAMRRYIMSIMGDRRHTSNVAATAATPTAS
jgi:hypothetical protein